MQPAQNVKNAPYKLSETGPVLPQGAWAFHGLSFLKSSLYRHTWPHKHEIGIPRSGFKLWREKKDVCTIKRKSRKAFVGFSSSQHTFYLRNFYLTKTKPKPDCPTSFLRCSNSWKAAFLQKTRLKSASKQGIHSHWGFFFFFLRRQLIPLGRGSESAAQLPLAVSQHQAREGPTTKTSTGRLEQVRSPRGNASL